MTSLKNSLQLVLLGLAIVVTIWTSEVAAHPASQDGNGGEPGEMTNALNYLAELDKYYSNVARPR